jgi:putative tricarboxylic transport membrane protein
MKLIRNLAVAAMATLLSIGNINAAEIDSIHFLIPGGAGGGWDGLSVF